MTSRWDVNHMWKIRGCMYKDTWRSVSFFQSRAARVAARGPEAERAGDREAGWKKFSSRTYWQHKCRTLAQDVAVVLVGKELQPKKGPFS